MLQSYLILFFNFPVLIVQTGGIEQKIVSSQSTRWERNMSKCVRPQGFSV